VAIIIGAGGPGDRQALPLTTRRGTRIPNEQRLERAPEGLRVARELWESRYPEARVRSLSSTYNCMGMAFATRRTWIDTDHLDMIFGEDGYQRVAEPSRVTVGDILVYRNQSGEAVHVGIVVARIPSVESGGWLTTVLSQWGADGAWIHPESHVPTVLGQPSEYWSERRLP